MENEFWHLIGSGLMAEDEQLYSEKETCRRMEAALRGATNKPRTQMKDIPRQRPYKARKRKGATESKSGESS